MHVAQTGVLTVPEALISTPPCSGTIVERAAKRVDRGIRLVILHNNKLA